MHPDLLRLLKQSLSHASRPPDKGVRPDLSFGVDEAFEEGDVAEIEFESGRVRNATRGTELTAKPLPPQLLSIVTAGGIYPLLEKEGLIAAKV